MAVLMALVGSGYAALIEVNQIGLMSRARGDVELELYKNWEQRIVNIYSEGTHSTGGVVAVEWDIPLGIEDMSRASVLSSVDYFGEALVWNLHTTLFGEDVGNAVFMSFRVNEPVAYDLKLGYPTSSSFPVRSASLAGGIFGYGPSGILGVGDYIFGYVDSWDSRGQPAYGGYVLTMDSTRVPDGGSTLLMFGIGMCVIGIGSLRKSWRLQS